MNLKSSGERIFVRQNSSQNYSSGQSEDRGFSYDNREAALKRRNRDERVSNSPLINFLTGVINVSLFAIFLGIPLFFTGVTYQGLAFDKQIYFYFWVLLALVAWIGKSGYLGELKIRRTPLDIPLLAFWFVYLISTVFSVDRWHSFFGFFGDPSRGFLSVTAIIIAYYLILSNFTQKLSTWLLRSLFISGTIISLWAFLLILGVNFLPAKLAAFMPLNLVGSLGGLTVFLMALIPLGIMRVFKIQEKNADEGKKISFSQVSHLLLILVNLFNLFALYVYASWLIFLIGMVFFLIFVLAKIVEPKNGWAILPMIVFVFILIFLMIGPLSLVRSNLPMSADISYGTSLTVAKESLRDNFFFGYGSANFGYAFSKNLPAGFDNYGVRFYQGQGLVFENISTLGVVGTVMFLVLIVTYLGSSIFLLSKDKVINKIESLGLLTASGILLMSAVSDGIEGSILLIWILVSTLSLGVLYRESRVEENFWRLSLKASPKFALTLAFIYLVVFAGATFMFVFVGKVFVADVKMESAINATEASEGGSISGMIKAININPREGRYYTRLGQEYMALTNVEMMKSEEERDATKIRNYLTLAIQAGKKGTGVMPNDVLVVESLAQIYENAGLYMADAYKLSADEYQKASELESFNPDFMIKIGQVKAKMSYAQKDEDAKKKLWEEARDEYKKAIEVRPGYSAAYYNLALAEEVLENQDEAINNMFQAFALQRSNLSYAFNLARLYQARGNEEDLQNAEILYKEILSVNDSEINTHFNLGTLYENQGKRDEAVSQYEKVLELLPEGSDEAETQIRKMITNVRNGVPNTPENLGLVEEQVQESVSAPAEETEIAPAETEVEVESNPEDVLVPEEDPVVE